MEIIGLIILVPVFFVAVAAITFGLLRWECYKEEQIMEAKARGIRKGLALTNEQAATIWQQLTKERDCRCNQ